MLDTTLTPVMPDTMKATHQLSLASFLDGSPTGYALFDVKANRLIYFNRALLSFLRCESYALSEVFPNGELLGIKEKDLKHRWRYCLEQTLRSGTGSMECTLSSVYEKAMTMNVSCWLIANTNSGLIGLKFEDITDLRKLKQEASTYIKII